MDIYPTASKETAIVTRETWRYGNCYFCITISKTAITEVSVKRKYESIYHKSIIKSINQYFSNIRKSAKIVNK